MKLLLKGGRVVDPANSIDGLFDVLVEDGKIAAVAPDMHVPDAQTNSLKGKQRNLNRRLQNQSKRNRLIWKLKQYWKE